MRKSQVSVRSVSLIASVALSAGLLVALKPSSANAAMLSSCGQTATTDMVLQSNVGPCPGDGIVVGADNVTIDLGGHTLTGVSAKGNGSAGIHLVGRRGVRVINGTVTGFDAGVAIVGGSGNTVSDLLARDNVGAPNGDFGDGIFVMNSRNNRIRNNQVIHNGPAEGIGIFMPTSVGNQIEHNLIRNNNIKASFFPPEFGIPPITEDHGINLGTGFQGSNRTIIANNVIEGSGLWGILACSYNGNPCISRYNLIVGNTVRNNGFGNQDEPVAVHATGGGIRVSATIPIDIDPVLGTSVRSNTVTGNLDAGIFVNGTGNDIIGNTALNNGVTPTANDPYDLFDAHFEAQGLCHGNVWFGNTYGTAFPPCTTVGGHQVQSATTAAEARSEVTSRSKSAGIPPLPPRSAPSA